jgi:hypothetical protein
MKLVTQFCAALTFVCSAASSVAASGDYLLPPDGIKGESSISRAQTKPRVPSEAASLAQPAKGGAPAAARRPDGTQGCEVCGGGDVLAPARKPPSALLLPAVQKVREAAAK